MSSFRSAVLFGPPGAGKSTLGRLLQKHYPGARHVSSGDIIREAYQGLDAFSSEDQEELVAAKREQRFVSDDLMFRLADAYTQRHRLDPDVHFLLLDGLPRTEGQVPYVQETFDPAAVLYLDAPRGVLVDRIKDRARAGEDQAVIKRRLQEYDETTAPLKHLYDTLIGVKKVDVEQSPTRVLREAAACLSYSPGARYWF